jgi:hypothetical protein
MRCLTDEPLKDSREVRLRTEAAANCDFKYRMSRRPKQMLRMFNPPTKQIFVGTKASRPAELSSEVHPRQACARGQVDQSDRLGQMFFNELDNPVHAPLLQGRCLTRRPRLASITKRNYARDNREAHAVGERLAKRGVRAMRHGQRLAQTFQHGVTNKPGVVQHNLATAFSLARVLITLRKHRLRHKQMQDVCGRAKNSARRHARRCDLRSTGCQAATYKTLTRVIERQGSAFQVQTDTVIAGRSFV